MAQKMVGRTTWLRPPTPYENYCDAQGIPIYRGIVGVSDVRDVQLEDWPARGGRGAFLDLEGTGNQLGIYLIEIPPGGELVPEHHLYEEVFYVVEGRGTMETWVDGVEGRQVFEWSRHSVFSPPMNTWHKLVNATGEPALLVAGTNAPPIMELFRNEDFIFNVPYHFKDRYDVSSTYFDAWEELGTDPLSLRALYGGAVVPDAANMELPLDGQRGSGHRHVHLRMSNNFMHGFIAQYPQGRYSKTHAHPSGPVLVCLAGQGYTLTWPKSAGTTPWADGNGHLVKRTDYKQGGIVSAAPGGSDWFHAHFGVDGHRFRVMAMLGAWPVATTVPPGAPVIGMNRDIKQGGNTIEYRDEDPMIRKMFTEALDKVGASFDMPDDVYE